MTMWDRMDRLNEKLLRVTERLEELEREVATLREPEEEPVDVVYPPEPGDFARADPRLHSTAEIAGKVRY